MSTFKKAAQVAAVVIVVIAANEYSAEYRENWLLNNGYCLIEDKVEHINLNLSEEVKAVKSSIGNCNLTIEAQVNYIEPIDIFNAYSIEKEKEIIKQFDEEYMKKFALEIKNKTEPRYHKSLRSITIDFYASGHIFVGYSKIMLNEHWEN